MGMVAGHELGGRTRLVTRNLCTSLQPLNLKFSEVCSRMSGRGWNLPERLAASGHNWRAIATEQQQLNWTRLGCMAGADAIGEQQLNWTRSGSK